MSEPLDIDPDYLRCGQCGDDLLPEHVEGHLASEGRVLPTSDGVRALNAVMEMYEFADNADSWQELVDTAKFVIQSEGLFVLEARIVEAREREDGV